MTDDRLQLIAEIFSRPALWNIHSEEHKFRSCIPELWKEVATNMGPDVTVDDCKRKWKNLRDAYRAELKRIDMRIENDILKCSYDPKKDYGSKWTYFEHMRFIKDVKRPRRKAVNKDNQNSSPSNDTYDDDENEFEEFSELHNIDGIKIEPDDETNTEPYKLNEENEAGCSQPNETEKQLQSPRENALQPTPTVTSDPLTQNASDNLQTTNETIDKPEPTCYKCSKRSYDQMHFLEDLRKEERTLIKSTRLDITRSNELSHIGDSDYNFLVSFLPQLKKMTELQNLKFRAKMTDLMFNIMSQSMASNDLNV